MTVYFSKTQQKLGTRIKALRLKDNISQEELAYKAKIERSYMGRIERGEGNPSLKKVVDIANALKVNLEELVS
jgi:transcriptional regulator with XRE-family HTH domain